MDPGGPLFGQGPLKYASQVCFGVHLGSHKGSGPPVWFIDGPSLGFDPMGTGSCVPRVYWYAIWLRMVIIGDFLQWVNWPPLALFRTCRVH